MNLSPDAHLLVTGADGFIGRHVVRAARDIGFRVLRGTRRPANGADDVPLDLRLPVSPAALCGVDVVLHCAHLIGGSAAELHEVNVAGTRRLTRTASAVGARVHLLSTAAIYGRANRPSLRAGSVADDPGSPTSVSRQAAERIVRDAGGWALRPHLVIGTGDRWVLPALLSPAGRDAIRREARRARHSVIHAAQVAELMVALAASVSDADGQVFHAAPREAMALGALTSLAIDAGLRDAGPSRVTAGRLTDMVRHPMSLDSAESWRRAGLAQPDRPYLTSQDVAWYRRLAGGPGELASEDEGRSRTVRSSRDART